MSGLNQDQVIEYLSGLTVLEIANLVKSLESKWGVSAAAAVAAAPASAAAAAAPVEEKTEFDLHLTEVGANKINVIKVVRELTNLGLKEAKEIVDTAPKAVKTAMSKADVETWKKKFEEVGAKVDVK
jgi:large subunit ribosomal protein L7/L12